MPKVFVSIGLILLTLALLPPALIARARSMNSSSRRIHIIQDMDNQAKFKAQDPNSLFADTRAMRPDIEGTVPRGLLRTDEHFAIGGVVQADGTVEWFDTLPDQVPLNLALLQRGQERFGIYCSICHGAAGYGDGIVHKRAMELVNNPAIGNGTVWVQPKSIHDPDIRTQPVGQVYNTITNGIRNMSGYQDQILIEDRWAIAAYVKTLQRSQNADPADLPEGTRFDDLDTMNLVPVEEEAAP